MVVRRVEPCALVHVRLDREQRLRHLAIALLYPSQKVVTKRNAHLTYDSSRVQVQHEVAGIDSMRSKSRDVSFSTHAMPMLSHTSA